MPTQKVGLYIGKFQPFHNGHLFAVQNILKQVQRLIIVIGSSQYERQANQPFSAQQRRQMIQQTLIAARISSDHYHILKVTDIHDNERWVAHVQKNVGNFDVVFSNNELVQALFREKNIDVQGMEMLPGVSGTLVRQKLADRSHDWVALVSPKTAQIILDSQNGVYPLQ